MEQFIGPVGNAEGVFRHPSFGLEKVYRVTVDKPLARAELLRIREGVELDGWMMKPGDFDPGRAYPVLVYVYGEPGNQTVTDRWGGSRMLWHHYLTQQGYIVLSLDPRGTPARSLRAKRWGGRQRDRGLCHDHDPRSARARGTQGRGL